MSIKRSVCYPLAKIEIKKIIQRTLLPRVVMEGERDPNL
jgi:hypothetical protein